MALTDLTEEDFQYYKSYSKKMLDLHEKEFIKLINPDLIRAFYRGRNSKQMDDTDERGYYTKREHFLALSRIFQGTNTLIPNLYYQNPSPIVVPNRGSDANSAALMTAVLKYYMKLNNAKHENQEAILNAWFFGIGWKKLGYRTVFMPRLEPEPESQLDSMDQLGQTVKSVLGIKPDNLESKQRPDIVDYEQLFNNSESPMNIMLDHKADLANCKVILHRLKRTLYDLQTFGDYDEGILKEIFEKMKYDRGTRLDTRDIDLDLNELHVQQRNGIWILTWVDQFPKPMRYEKSTYQGKGFQFDPIVFTNEPGVRYPISHMKIATQVQEQLDYMATLFVRIIDRVRNQIIVNQKDLAPGQEKALVRNELGGIILTNKPITPGTFQQLTSAAVQNDLPMLMTIVQQNLTEILGADPQLVSGTSKNKTLGQDELARVGTKVRESGMLDKVRDWMIRQFEKEAVILKQYSNSELHLQITGKDYTDPMIGQTVEQKWVSFMTPENPLGLKHYLQGEFDFDVNVYEAIKPDKDSIQREYITAIELFGRPEIQQAMLMNSVKPRIDKLAEGFADQFEFLKGETFIEKLDPMQAAAAQASMVLMQNGGQVPGSQVPKTPNPTGANKQGVTSPSSEAAQL